jgi:hypothetical protein
MLKYILMLLGILVMAGAAGSSDLHPEQGAMHFFVVALVGLVMFAAGVALARCEDTD